MEKNLTRDDVKSFLEELKKVAISKKKLTALSKIRRIENKIEENKKAFEEKRIEKGPIQEKHMLMGAIYSDVFLERFRSKIDINHFDIPEIKTLLPIALNHYDKTNAPLESFFLSKVEKQIFNSKKYSDAEKESIKKFLLNMEADITFRYQAKDNYWQKNICDEALEFISDRSWEKAFKDMEKATEFQTKQFIVEKTQEFLNSIIAIPPLNMSNITMANFITKDMVPRKYYLRPWIRQKGIILIFAWRGVGKTWLVYAILQAIATGKGFAIWPCENKAKCLLIDGEMPKEDVKERAEFMMMNSDNIYNYNVDYLYEIRPDLPKANLFNTKWRIFIEDIIFEHDIKIVVFDNYSTLTINRDENTREGMGDLQDWFKSLRFKGITVILIHHENKKGDQRGFSGREDCVDMSVRLVKPKDYEEEHGCRFIIKFQKHRVQNDDLDKIKPLELWLETSNGKANWEYYNVKNKDENKNTVLEMIVKGELSQTEIGEHLGLTKGRVSQIKSKAITDGILIPRKNEKGFELNQDV